MSGGTTRATPARQIFSSRATISRDRSQRKGKPSSFMGLTASWSRATNSSRRPTAQVRPTTPVSAVGSRPGLGQCVRTLLLKGYKERALLRGQCVVGSTDQYVYSEDRDNIDECPTCYDANSQLFIDSLKNRLGYDNFRTNRKRSQRHCR